MEEKKPDIAVEAETKSFEKSRFFSKWTAAIVSLAIGFSCFLALRVFYENSPYLLWAILSCFATTLSASTFILFAKVFLKAQPKILSILLWSFLFICFQTFGVWLWTTIGIGTIAAWYTTACMFLFVWMTKYAKQTKVKRKREFFPIGFSILATVILCVTAAWIVQRALVIPSAQIIDAQAPTLKELDSSLKSADRFLEGLYKKDGSLPPSNVVEDGTGSGLTARAGNTATVSEYYGLPIRIRTERDPRYRLLGDTAVRVKPLVDGATSENSLVSFNLTRGETPKKVEADNPYFSLSQYNLNQEIVFNAVIEVDWNYSSSQIELSFRSVQRTPPRTRLFVRLGDKPLGWWDTNNTGKQRTFLIDKKSRALFQSFRYTTRHATQGGEYFFRYHKDFQKADSLRKTLQQTGFARGYDLYSAIWDQDKNFGLYDLWKNNNYRDCKDRPTRTRNAYLYASKICKLPLDVYRWLAVPDPLLPTELAVHSLHLSNNPDKKYHDLDKRPRTARTWARRLEKLYRDKQAKGLVRCNPLQCESSRFSTIRTAYMGALEAELGYKYGDKTSKTYADRIAQNMLRLQIQKTGFVIANNRNAYYRPVQKGGFYSIYDGAFLNKETLSLVSKLSDKVLTSLDMPREYLGIIPGNAETGFAVYGFLKKYRCLKYKVGCESATSPIQPSTSVFYETMIRPYRDVFKHLLSPDERKLRPEPAAPDTKQSNDENAIDKSQKGLLGRKPAF